MNIVFILSALIASTVAEPVDSTLASSQILNLLNTESRPQSMMIPFEEIRIHRIRKEPLRFAGIMRINPALGISVAYSEPEETTFILTSGGLRRVTICTSLWPHNWCHLSACCHRIRMQLGEGRKGKAARNCGDKQQLICPSLLPWEIQEPLRSH